MKAKQIHDHMYDYSSVIYVDNKTPVKIFCKIHGNFLQKPIYHINRKSGCLCCYRDKQKITEDQFLQLARKKFNNFFSYGKYFGFRNKMDFVCSEHGKFITTPAHHLRPKGKGGCVVCKNNSFKKSLDFYIPKFNKIHHNKYSYSKAIYVNSATKIEVICTQHGSFYPTPNNHVKGHGCPVCACSNYIGGYSEEFFQNNPLQKNEKGTLYFLKIYDLSKAFYKIGITKRTVFDRFKSIMPYKFEILLEQEMSLYNAHLIEMKFLKETKNIQYIPQIRFPGWTECIKQNKYKLLSKLITTTPLVFVK